MSLTTPRRRRRCRFAGCSWREIAGTKGEGDHGGKRCDVRGLSKWFAKPHENATIDDPPPRRRSSLLADAISGGTGGLDSSSFFSSGLVFASSASVISVSFTMMKI